ncbi:MAG: MFS transporter [Opitutaceae bacterium]|nr:MFS transporter [Opitutaceae bacterium]
MSSSPVSPDRRYLVLVAAFLGWMFDGMEMGIFPLVARPALLEMQAATGVVDPGYIGRWMGTITALFLLGAACGGLVFGWLGDRIGRVRAMSLAILSYSLFTGAAYFAQTPQQLGGLRFLAALGMGGEWSLGVALVMEVWPEKHRPWLAGVIGAAANVGFALIGVLGIFFSVTQDSWRWVMLVGAAPALLTFVIRLFVPESERWIQATARAGSSPVREMLAPGLLMKTVLATVFASVALIGSWGSVQWLPLWADQMAGAGAPQAKAYTQTLTAFGAILGCLAGSWLGGRLGRRPAYFGLCLASLLSCAWLFRFIDTYGTLFLLASFVVGTATAAFYGWLPLYLPELFPTRVRATAQGVAFNTGRIFAAAAAVQMGALMRVFDGSYARAGAIITLVYLIGMAVIWLAPETRGRPLPE